MIWMPLIIISTNPLNIVHVLFIFIIDCYSGSKKWANLFSRATGEMKHLNRGRMKRIRALLLTSAHVGGSREDITLVSVSADSLVGKPCPLIFRYTKMGV